MNGEGMRLCGILLAGGQSRRMGGGDKCLRALAGKTVLARIIGRIGPQVDTLVLNANGDTARFAEYGLRVIPDAIGDFAGPLAGVLTGMEWASQHGHPTNGPDKGGEVTVDSGYTHILTVPTDAPFLPTDLVERLAAPIQAGEADMTCAMSDGRTHPVVGIWPISLAGDLRRAMVDEDIRKVDRWTARHRLAEVPFGTEPFDPFFNMNRPEDAQQAAEYAALVDR
ncbi:molybdenum cofactor guanylyltransferase [Hwanghaeella grinnelliae]|uniref:Molybdenum cofactor guanylyltransferase n=1 Tax=Hwanghaeella grinnelliae TaxID=2500179 RepID=A0A437QWC8_9PROT|nr:molybdenum cofactor guanylyltransferase MobA [Hwanghaeella grinnelliae]RVU38716.1 molybdenum cofactor guanylyltransferase [Hwanghaeella grinnelliae]